MTVVEEIRKKLRELDVLNRAYLKDPSVPGLLDKLRGLQKEISGLQATIKVVVPEKVVRATSSWKTLVGRVLLKDGRFGDLVSTDHGLKIELEGKLIETDTVEYVIAQPKDSKYPQVQFRPSNKKPKPKKVK